VQGVSGKPGGGITENVNFMAANPDSQVRGIAQEVRLRRRQR